MARTGMANLTARWRRMVDDTGTAVWTADEAQQILDAHRTDVWDETLNVTAIMETGSTVYKTYHSKFDNLEETTGGTTIFRLYDSGGTAIGTALYTPDYERGVIQFAADQAGSTRYLDARAYDLTAAAADGWTERMAKVSGWYSFQSEGKGFNRSDYFKHCKSMADYYSGQSPMTVTLLKRSDIP